MTIFLVPVGRNRFELYSEPPDEGLPAPSANASVVRRWAHAASVQWQALVEAARQGSSTGLLARWRDRLVRRVAESIAEQRTFWTLRHQPSATLRYPSTLDETGARRVLTDRFAYAQRLHLRWLLVDTALLAASAVFAIVPGPNILAYYLAFRVFGHLAAWRGARHADRHVTWALEADDSLAELASLAAVPRDARARQVADIARRLNLARLPTFFERTAT